MLYHVSPKIRQGLIVIFAPANAVGLIFRGCFFSCTIINIYSNTVMSSSGGGQDFTEPGLMFGVGLIFRETGNSDSFLCLFQVQLLFC